MLDFQRGPRPRNYFSRRQQWRLLLLVMMLGLVVVMAHEARKPKHFAWMWAAGQGGAEHHAARLLADVPLHPGAAPERLPGVDPELLESIRDDLPFLHDERHAWFHLLSVLRKTDLPTLEAASAGTVTYVQLLQQASEYRGHLVSIRGIVRRAERQTAPKNDLAFDHYYQTWLTPADDPDNLVVVYCLDLPEGFPTGMKLEEGVALVGFFFKRWVYPAQDKPRSAPVVLAKSLRWHKKPPAAPPPDDHPGSMMKLVGFAALFALTVTLYVAYLTRRGGRKTTRGLSQFSRRGLSQFSRRGLSQFSRSENGTVPFPNPRLSAFWLAVIIASASTAPAAPKISGPRELLALFGIDQGHFDRLTDGVPWQQGENELLMKMLLRSRDFRPEELEGWARDKLPPAGQPEYTEALRGEVFRLRARVVLVHPIRPPPEFRERFEIEEYFRCRLRLEDDDRPAVVFARNVPTAWKQGQPIDRRAGALGFFLKLGADQAGTPEPIFVAPRVAWYPDSLLGNLGMDAGLFDDLRSARPNEDAPGAKGPSAAARLRDMRLTSRNRECFYQLLAAAGRAQPGQIIREAQAHLTQNGKESFSVVPLFNQPGRQHGRLVVLSGTAREVLLIRVADQDVQARFGITHYYQISVFTDDSQGNPLVFCVREIPEGMPTGKGPQFGEYVTVAGFFFNTWAYHSALPSEDSDSSGQWQLAPLLIGRDLAWRPRQAVARNPMAGAFVAGAFALVLFGIWLMLWRYSRSDKRFRASTLSRHLAPEPGADFPKDDRSVK